MEKNLSSLLKKYHQNEFIKYLNDLEKSDKKAFSNLIGQINEMDLPFFFEKILPFLNSAKPETKQKIEPFPTITRAEVKADEKFYKQCKKLGEKTLSQGKVGFLLVAGGQGSRLGFEHPKGMFPVGPITGNSLFRIHTEKIIASGKYYDFKPVFFIMTSQSNHDETLLYFKNNDYFGFSPENIYFFSQGMLPAVDTKGNLIMENKEKLFNAPDGHGGTLTALRKNNLFKIMKQKGISIISYFQVDNPLVDMCDPIFIGLHCLKGAQVSSKVLKKRDWKEKVGVPATLNGKPAIIEYSDLPDELARKTDENNELAFGFGSIAIHLFNRELMESVSTEKIFLPFHVARKKIPCFDPVSKAKIEPAQPNGIKFEQFIFDSIPFAENALFYETLRDLEFKPLKNRIGEDSIKTCSEGISRFFGTWLEKTGVRADNNSGTIIEISPFFACCEDEFKTKFPFYLKRIPGKIYLG